MKKIIIVVLVLFCFSPASLAEEEKYIRVKVLEGANSISISCFTPIKIRDSQTQKLLLDKPALLNFKIRPVSQGLNLGGVPVETEKISIESSSLGIIALGKRQYRGKIECQKESENSLLIINDLPIEEYLYGVLKHEVSPGWPPEALKAQAVAGRSFALYKAEINSDENYHLTNTVLSQVYAGFLSEDPILTEAINETRGEVLTYKGKIIPAYYHATCGGWTESPKYVWAESRPYLRARQCSYCKNSPHFYWKAKLSLRRITQAFRRKGYKFNRIVNLKALGKSPSGRIKKIVLIHNGGRTVVKGNDFRLILGPEIIKSTNFKMKKVGSAVEFKGKGWGHGVGLCQWGARGMASKGFKYDKILKFYYPDAKIKTIY